MKIIAIDYGDVRTGVAICDKFQILSTPYCTIVEKDQDILVGKICEIIKKESVEAVVIGLPINMNGSAGYRCKECESLGNKLMKMINIPIYYQDERLTTVMANNTLSMSNVKSKKRKKNVDNLSAAFILDSFLKSGKLDKKE